MSQHEAIVRYLAERPGEWVPGYTFCKATLGDTWVGSRGDRSARDLAKWGKYELGGTIYFVERQKMLAVDARGNRKLYAHYRVAFSQRKPTMQADPVIVDGEWRMRITMPETKQSTLL